MRGFGRSWRASTLAVVIVACGDDGAAGVATDGEDTTSGATTIGTTIDPSTSSTGEPDESTTSETGSTSETTAAPCDVGEEGCRCHEDFSCSDGLACELNTCVACEAGTFACPCIPPENEGEPGTCGSGLFCVAGLCATAPACPWRNDGVCDEPRGTNACFEGTDPEDCEGMSTDTDTDTGTDTGTDTTTDTESVTGTESGTGTDSATATESVTDTATATD